LPESRVDWKAYFKARLKSLRDEGLSGSLASKVANAEVKALAAAYDLFAALDEMRDAGKPDAAGEVWVGFYAALLTSMPKKIRKDFMEIVLKVAEEMDRED
jgi:hypothetical protein